MKKTAIALSIFTAVAATALPAQADTFRFGFYGPNGGVQFSTNDFANFKQVRHSKRDYRRVDPLPPRRIARILRRNGFHDVHAMRTNGRFYKAKAYNKRGRLVRLKVNAYSGKIVKRKVVRRMRHVPDYTYNMPQRVYADRRQPFWMY